MAPYPSRADMTLEVKRLWDEGLTQSQIGAMLGVTKNVVAGIVTRARRAGYEFKRRGLVPPPQAAKVEPKKKGYQPTLAKIPKRKAAQQPEDATHAVSFLDLKYCHCRFVIGTPHGFDTLYCGKVKKSGSSYCEEHHARTHAGIPEDKKKSDRQKASKRHGRIQAALRHYSAA